MMQRERSAKAMRIVSRLVNAHESRCTFRSTDEAAPSDLHETYLVQDEVLQRLHPGGRAAVWKVSPPGVLETVASPIAPSRCFTSPTVLPADRFNMLAIELEIAFRFGRDLPPRATHYGNEELRDAVDEALVAIELCDTRLSDWREASPLWRLADFQSNGALVLGTGTTDWRSIDFAAAGARLRINGAVQKLACGSHPSGDPSRLLPWLVEHCAGRCGGVRAGDVVTTGSWTGMYLATAGDEIHGSFPGIGEASVSLAV
jgi:2-keto-4-pentenoate hydratase